MRTFLIICIFLLATAGAAAQSERTFLRDGNQLYKQNKYSDAEVNYRKALEKDQAVKQGPFNLGDALYKQDRFGEAAEQYSLAASKLKDPDQKAEALHNLGNALLRAKKIPESIASYQNALKLNPSDADTKYNLEYAKMLLQKQQEQQQQQQKNDKNDKNQKKDQQKQDQQKQDQQKQDQQKQDQQKQQQQQDQNQDQQKQQDRLKQQKKQQISKQDAERILQAMKNEEKDVQKKLHKKVQARVQVEKDW
jgi:Ca-activated chloride channel homolog